LITFTLNRDKNIINRVEKNKNTLRMTQCYQFILTEYFTAGIRAVHQTSRRVEGKCEGHADGIQKGYSGTY
jgi:hypothetical protein